MGTVRPGGEQAFPDLGGAPVDAIVLRLLLGTQLRRFREAAGITPEVAGGLIRGSRSKISRMETGRVRFKIRDVTDLLTAYGVIDEQVQSGFLALAQQSSQPDWWAKYADILPDWFETYLGRALRLSGVQVGNRLPVPGRADRAVYQGRSVAADDLGRVWNARAENFRDGRPQEVPAAADGRLAAAEYPARESLGDVAAHQHYHHGHGIPKADDGRLPCAGFQERADLTVHENGEHGELASGQPRGRIVVQRFLCFRSRI